MITMDLFHKARALRQLGKNDSEIGEELSLHRKTVGKYLKSSTPPKYTPRRSPSRADPFVGFESFTRDVMTRVPEISASEVYALLRPRGFSGSERTVERRLKRWREEEPKERFFEQEYTPGEQAQFDFKESVEIPFIDDVRVVHLHFGTLPYSDKCVIKGFPQKTYECFMDGVHSFFEAIGGITENIRIDNLSPCIKKVRSDGGRDYTSAFLRALEYYGFGVLPCSPGKGNEKGDVERDIQTWARRFKNHVKVHGIKFRDFAHLNESLSEFIVMEERKSDLFVSEQQALKALLPRDECVLCRVDEVRASSFGTVRMDKAKTTYSVPDEWIGSWCKVVAGPFEVKITRVGVPTVSVIHERKPEGENSIKLEHVLRSLIRKPQAMIRWSHREMLFPDEVFREFYRRLKKSQGEMPGAAEREFLRTINLIHYVSLKEIRTAIEIVLASEAVDFFNEIKELLLIERRPEASVIEISTRMKQVPFAPNLNQYDELIPARRTANEGGQ